MDQGDMARQVEGDLGPMFAELEARKREAAFNAFPSIDRPRRSARRRGSRALWGGMTAAALLIVAGGALVTPAWLHRPKPAPVARPDNAPEVLALQARSAPAPASETLAAAGPPETAVPAPADDSATPPLAAPAAVEPEPREPVPTPPMRVASLPPAEPPPFAPRPVETVLTLPEEAAAQGCAPGDDACLAADVAEADRLLAYAYRQAWLAKVPSSRVRAVQRAWRPGVGVAADTSNQALLNAYAVRTRDVWAMIDRWERERRQGP